MFLFIWTNNFRKEDFNVSRQHWGQWMQSNDINSHAQM